MNTVDTDVALVWYNDSCTSHVAIAVDDVLYGFNRSYPIRESSSLRKSIFRIQGALLGQASQAEMLTVQYLYVTLKQKKKIGTICKKSFLPCTNCMHAVARIISDGMKLHIPFPINHMPDTALVYLEKLQKNGSQKLGKQIAYGIEDVTAVNQLKSRSDTINRLIAAGAGGFGCVAFGMLFLNGIIANTSARHYALFAIGSGAIVLKIHRSFFNIAHYF